MRISLILLFLVTVLSGCSTQWVKNRFNAEDFSFAKEICEEKAGNKFPVKNEVAQRTKYTRFYETCLKNEICDGNKYKTVRQPEIESYVMDVNKDSRDNFFYQCMSQLGWKAETKLLGYSVP